MAILAIFMSVNLVSCSSDDDGSSNRLVGTWICDNWDSRGITTYNFKSDGTYTSKCGVYYSESGHYTYEHPLWTESENGGKTNVYTVVSFEKDYFVVMNKYADTYTFYRNEGLEEEQVVSGTVQNHDYVDLGLSVKWATCNIGASKPEYHGSCFLWGETTGAAVNFGESDYDKYKFHKWSEGCDQTGLTKYCTSEDYGYCTVLHYNSYYKDFEYFVDNLTTLLPEDDAATVRWGNQWRMPTKAEIEELLNKCTWTWTQHNGYNGYRVTGRNGNSIFLPTVYEKNHGTLVGERGSYWSSSLIQDWPESAWNLYFNYSHYSIEDANVYSNTRYHAKLIRPVLK